MAIYLNGTIALYKCRSLVEFHLDIGNHWLIIYRLALPSLRCRGTENAKAFINRCRVLWIKLDYMRRYLTIHVPMLLVLLPSLYSPF
jgi:hypothetical protein